VSRETSAPLPVMPHSLRPVTPAGILAARLERAVRLAEGVDAPFELLDELREAAALASGLEPYVERCTTPESVGLAIVAARTRAMDWDRADASQALEAEMLSGHVEGQLLKFLVAMTGARRVLEIGMFTGYSALAIAEALGADGRLVACEIDPTAAAFAEASFAAAGEADPALQRAEIEIRLGPAAASLAGLAEAGESFDLVFVDADKAGYLGYVDQILSGNLLTEGGTICVDNTLLQGEPWLAGDRSENGAAIAGFNAAIADDPRLEQVLLPVRDGVTLIRRAR
jgi:caffeoyl-CoA O-methyltransferase